MSFQKRSAQAHREGPFEAAINGGMTTFKNREGAEISVYEISATGLGGSGKAAGRNISISLKISDLEAALADAKAQGQTHARLVAWKRDGGRAPVAPAAE